ncbi:MAG: hypothetical protein JWQ96_1976 [Segetibacter sp.]|nr:hypothetical protein [Segetibacter sp.]
MRILLLFMVFAFTATINLTAQYLATDTFGSVIVKKDPRLDVLSSKQTEINKRAARSGTRRIRGYRIQAANTQNRDEANAVKAEMLRRFPDEKSYLLYQAPNYRVRVGNFLTQKEAQTMRKMISALYPQRGIFIVSDIIEYTPKEEEWED